MSFIKYGTKNRDILYATFDLNWVYGGAGNDDLYAGTEVIFYTLCGDDGNDNLFGRRNCDTLDGGRGADRMMGGGQSDKYYVDNGGDVVIERAGEGTYDFVSATINYTLTANVEILNLGGTAALRGTGNALDNRIRGNSANNVIDGGRGADEMIGQAGDDTYYVDNVKDKVWEEYNGGYDTIYSSVSIKIPQNFSSYDKTYDYNNNFIERIILIGDQAIDAQGNNLNNVLIGNDAANRLDGQRGADILRGGLGNDTYLVDTGDKVVEFDGQGVDTVVAGVDWVLGAHIENLTMGAFAAVNGVGVNGNGNGTGNALDNVITGNFLSNILKGAGGNDRMYGGAGNDTLQGQEGSDALWGEAGNDHLHAEFGADTLYGGAGNDVYWIKSSGHTLKEEAGEGFDQVNSHVTWILGDNFENLDLLGTADIDATGNAGRNVIRGNEGANVIDGGGGADQLFGEGGADTFVIHNEPDAPDVIAFSVGENLLRFSSKEFGGITKIDETILILTSATQIQPFTAPRFSYDATSGWLSFHNDAQGSFYIAKLSVSTLRPMDFEIVP